MNGFGESFERGMGQGAGLGAQMFRDIQARRAAAQAEAENKRRWEAEMALKQKALDSKPSSTLPPGLKLSPDQRYNEQTASVEVIPGSKLYQTQAGQHAKDYGALSGTKQKTDAGMKTIENFMSTPGALESQFGAGYSGVLTQHLNPGAKNVLNEIKATIRSAGLDMMRQGGSIGMMTEREWPMVEQLMASINNTISEEDARMQMEKVKAKLKNIQNEAARIYQMEWQGTPFQQQGQQMQQMPSPGGMNQGGGMDQDAKMRRLQELRAKRGM